MIDQDDLACRVAREESRHQAGIGTCSLALQMGFFFDGRERNINVDEDSHRLTNVSRLFRAHPREFWALAYLEGGRPALEQQRRSA